MEKVLIKRVIDVVVIVSYISASVSSNKWVQDEDFENNLDTSQLLWEKDGVSLLTCCSLCNSNVSCKSFFFHNSLKKCLGSQSYKRGLPSGQSLQQGLKYYTEALQCDGDDTLNETLGLCCKLHPENKTFLEAMDACEAEEAKLIIIRNQMEFVLVSDAVKAAAGSLQWPYIRLRKSLSNGNVTWKWWNGQEASYLKWSTGEPNNKSGNENCVDFSSDFYEYNDDACWHQNSFICQKNI